MNLGRKWPSAVWRRGRPGPGPRPELLSLVSRCGACGQTRYSVSPKTSPDRGRHPALDKHRRGVRFLTPTAGPGVLGAFSHKDFHTGHRGELKSLAHLYFIVDKVSSAFPGSPPTGHRISGSTLIRSSDSDAGLSG